MQTIAVKISYINPRTQKRDVSNAILTGYNSKEQSINNIIETLQKKIKIGYVLDRLPSIAYQVCDDSITAMIVSTKL